MDTWRAGPSRACSCSIHASLSARARQIRTVSLSNPNLEIPALFLSKTLPSLPPPVTQMLSRLFLSSFRKCRVPCLSSHWLAPPSLDVSFPTRFCSLVQRVRGGRLSECQSKILTYKLVCRGSGVGDIHRCSHPRAQYSEQGPRLSALGQAGRDKVQGS